MKKLFAALILSVGLTPAWAEWALLGRTDIHNSYINFSSIVRSGELVRGWFLFDTSTTVAAGSAASFVFLVQANCKTGQMRDLQGTNYLGQMGGGKVLRSYNTPGEWSYPVPGTLQEEIFTALCNSR